ncbi:dTDP-4-dehydrorhamnose reductase [Flavobacterium sp. H122]|uniref:dTDP-4-dehydrorhamnose reductase n=1 Tax=Flavobacterium sp. H122 TaxID=2529860 RepID=UPI0010AB3FE6|nr:dTDP-4-dehydrorhamnose reductase [Flavobacterium sp. H122]
MVVLVTGALGQLGQSLQFIASQYPEMQFIFASSQDLDITNEERVTSFFENNKIGYCINTAAYTAVDKAESEIEKAHLVNVTGPKNLAIACQKNNAVLIHISTDFVFNGTSEKPYLEADATNPIGVYGQTKLDGETEVVSNCNKYYIIRTSWVYSQFGNNFMKTMLRLAQDRTELNVVADQIGTPTNAVDLAGAVLEIISSDFKHSAHDNYGIYNFSNEGICSWYDFAVEIFKQNNINIKVNPIPTEAYPTPAKRPGYSVLDKSKIKSTFGITIKNWQEALAQTKI